MGVEQVEQSAVIALDGSVSGGVDLKGKILCGLQMPAEWTAADLTFKASADGITYNDLHDDEGNEVSVVAAASRFISLSPAPFAGIRYIQVRSGTTGTPVAQVAARTIKLITKAV